MTLRRALPTARGLLFLLPGCAGAPQPPSSPPAFHPAEAGSCQSCHPAQTGAWQGSQHARATRPWVGPAPSATPTTPVAIIGVEPLHQLLLPAEGGRFQVYDPAQDSRSGAWFSIYGEHGPAPSEWGHWTGRAMTWNSQCAFCHMTDFVKDYDAPIDQYRSHWSAAGIGCAACHGAGHNQAPTRPDEVCGPCHARHEDLTGRYRPDQDMDAHFRVQLDAALYQPDGQANDEVFELGSFRLSAMGLAGISCLDCHDPHSGATKAAGNTLCLSCHGVPTRRGAPPITAAHSHHSPGSPGDQCVACHMPQQTYMERDRRRDHAFTSPDPALATQIGTPDACSDCHPAGDRTLILAAADRWFPDRDRRRPLLIAALKAGAPVAGSQIAALLHAEENPAWRELLLSLLPPYADAPEVQALLRESLADPAPGVRAAAIRALARFPQDRPAIAALREDRSLSVRLSAWWAGRSRLSSPPPPELLNWLALHADHPAGAIRQSEWAIVQQRPRDALWWAERAVAWDPSLPSYHTLARALTAAGRREEAERLLKGAPASVPPPH